MVKISIKKDKKRKTKPRQKQKQKQTQNVVVNIGSNTTRAKRRSTGQALEKNKTVIKPQPTPTINVPQANPLYKQSDSTGEILRYIRESEQQKEMIKKQEKNNELEKDKIKKASGIPTEEKAQIQFSLVNSQNISSITSGTATPNPLSTPLNFRSLQNALGALIDRADIEGENPNTGRISLSTYNPNPLSQNVSSNSSIIPQPEYVDDNESVTTYETRTPLKHINEPYSLAEFLATQQPEPAQEVIAESEPEEVAITEPQLELVETQQPPIETITNEPSEVDAVIIDTPEPEKTAYEQADEAIKMMDDALKPNKATESRQAEDTGQMLEIKTVDTPRTPPQFTKGQLKKMRANQVGDILTAEKVKDKGQELIFNGSLFFRGREEVKLPEVKKILLSQYGVEEL